MSVTDSQSAITRCNQLFKDAEYWFRASELSVVNGTYFQTDPTKKKIPESIRNHNNKVKRDNFISTKNKIELIIVKYLETLKPIVHNLELYKRKEMMQKRYKMAKMMKACDHYIEIFS